MCKLSWSQVLWYHHPSRPDLLRAPHDCGVCSWWGSGRQRLQRNIPGRICAGQWVPAFTKRIHILNATYSLLSYFHLCSTPSVTSFLFLAYTQHLTLPHAPSLLSHVLSFPIQYLFHLFPHDSLWPTPVWLLLPFKGRVVRVSLPAAQGSVFSSSGCAMDGTTALTVQMNRVVATPPTLHSVSLWYLWPPSESHKTDTEKAGLFSCAVTDIVPRTTKAKPARTRPYLHGESETGGWMQNTVYESRPWCKIEFLPHTLSFIVRVHRGGDVSRPKLQPYVIPKHLAVHCWSERSHHTPETVPGKRGISCIFLLSTAVKTLDQSGAKTKQWMKWWTYAGSQQETNVQLCWTFKHTHLPFLFPHPGADGARVFRALTETGVWDVSASV